MEEKILATQEQKEIIEKLKDNNLIIEAIAGSGKTTTSLLIAKHFKKSNILLLTYSSKVKEETRKRKDLWNLKNLEVHSLHSFGWKFYNKAKEILNDEKLKSICNNSKAPYEIFNFDLIIIDEIQDINATYYEFICKIITDNEVNCKICVIGDKHQAIYSYRNADARYLSLANKFFDFNEYNWLRCSLSQSFRIHDKIANFINEVFYQKNIMKTNIIDEHIPEYVVTDEFNLYHKIRNEITSCGPENIFVLATSATLKKVWCQKLSNKFKNENIPIYYPYKNEKLDPSIPSNALYVAITRAMKKLILVQYYKNAILPFLDVEKLKKHCRWVCKLSQKNTAEFEENFKKNNSANNTKKQAYKKKYISVTELIRHTPQYILDKCTNLLTCEQLISEFDFAPIELESSTKEKKYLQNISAIRGVAIPLYFEWARKQTLEQSHILENIQIFLEENKNAIPKQYPELLKYQDFLSDLMNDSRTFNEKKLFKLSCIWLYLLSKGNFQLNQINEQDYDCINSKQLNQLAGLMHEYTSDNILHEQKYSLSGRFELYDKTLTGFIDCIDYKYKTVWEYKCVNSLNDVNYLQLAIYAYLFETQRKIDLENLNKSNIFNVKTNDVIQFKNMNNDNEKKKREKQSKQKYNFLLFNIVKNEIYKINYKYESLKKIVDILIWDKYFEFWTENDTDFIKNNTKIKQKYLNSNNERKKGN